MVPLETRHVRAGLKAQPNKTDTNDAHGVAQLVRSSWYRDVYVKSGELSAAASADASARVQAEIPRSRERDRHSLKVFGMKLSGRTDELCRRFMAVPGVGPVVALTFKTTVDDPARFKRSRDVGAYAGLTPKRIQSGDSIDYDGHISRQGDGELRTALYEAASGLMTRSKSWCTLKAWGMKLQRHRHRGHERALVAAARKPALIRHAMWRDGSEFRFGQAPERRRDGRSSVPATT
jgi:transposase